MTTLYKNIRIVLDGDVVHDDDLSIDIDLSDVLGDTSFDDVMSEGIFDDDDVVSYARDNIAIEDVLDAFDDTDSTLGWISRTAANDEVRAWFADNYEPVEAKPVEPLEVTFRQSTDMISLYIVEVDGVALGWALLSDSATFRVEFGDIDSGQIKGCPNTSVFPIVTGYVRFHEAKAREFVALRKLAQEVKDGTSAAA